MIDERISVREFFWQLIDRRDGQILIVSVAVSLGMAVLNLSSVAANALSLLPSEKWLVLWLFMPIILLFIHIRIRQLIETEGIVTVVIHAAVMFVTVGIFVLKNWGVI